MSIESLMDKADKQMDYSSYKKAWKLYEQALDLIPEPKEEHEIYLELMAAMGDVLISQGKNGEAMKLYTKIMRHPDADLNGFLHLRMGQIAYENGKMEYAEAELKRALELGGEELFENEYEEYYECATGKPIQ